METGSPNFPIERTFTFTVYFDNRLKSLSTPTPKTYQNPIFLAKKYAAMISSGAVASEAALARQLGISRARVNQIMLLLKLDKSIIEIIESFGDPMDKPFVSERMLRKLLKSPATCTAFVERCLH